MSWRERIAPRVAASLPPLPHSRLTLPAGACHNPLTRHPHAPPTSTHSDSRMLSLLLPPFSRSLYSLIPQTQILKFLENEEMHITHYGLGLKGTLALVGALEVCVRGWRILVKLWIGEGLGVHVRGMGKRVIHGG